MGLFAGIAAKEAVVGTMGMVYAGVEECQTHNLHPRSIYPLSAYAFLIMSLLYTPCAATIATIYKETNSKGWAWFSAAYTFLIGWTGAVVVYQVGRLFGLA